ncbi:MAG: DEAD/DEAH box helicase [Vicinamibacteria bacterium]|nr:DEAD/DEAH box helicase [Vicinamibacteria bacterium]
MARSSPADPDPLAAFHPAVAEWFRESFAAPTRAQALAWPEIRSGRSTLVFAPTGSGKTLAAFLAALDRLMFAAEPKKKERCRLVYVSPLKALAVDVERNLRAPIAGIARVASRRGDAFRIPEVAIRTGDTPQNERARQRRDPPDILITTPESLFLVLTSEARLRLDRVETAIVDEIHVLVGTKRGAHLALSLERLEELQGGRALQRIGLSATQRPLDTVARYLGGGLATAKTWKPRPVSIVDAGARKAFDLKVEVPVEDMAKLGQEIQPAEMPEGDASVVQRRSIWPAVHPVLLERIRAHRSTIVFVNSRRLAERLAAALNELAGCDLVRAHHGSIAREQRSEIEDALKRGVLPAIVATSSLELGIDMGAVDLVIQIETPPSVASGMQRIGRASHQVEAVSRGLLFPKFRGDLLATAAIVKRMHEGAVEETRLPENPLDVLAQQMAAIAVTGERKVEDLFALVRRAAPFANLPRSAFEGTLDMLAGRYPSDEFAELRPRLTWDRLRGVVRAREGTAKVVFSNAGTIPDRGLYGVFLADGEGAPGTARRTSGRRVGELDEEMVFESREGDVFLLGATSWRIVEISRDRVLVVPEPGRPGRMPFWKADRPPRPVELGRAIGSLTRELLAAPKREAHARLVRDHALEPRAADNLLAYLRDQKAQGVVPDDRTLVLERMRDELGDWRLCLLSPLGGRLHAPWALAIGAKLRRDGIGEAETLWTDDGIVVRLPDRERPPDLAALLPEPEEIEDLVVGELSNSALFAATFREAAARALLLPRRRPGQRSPLWMQRKRAADLLAVASRFGSFPIVLEAFRECLKDVFDLPGLVELARAVRRREVRLHTVDVAQASPFAASLLFGYVGNFMYEGDLPLAERKALALSVDAAQLRELLGEGEARELIDPLSLGELEEALQGTGGHRRANGPDRVHDLLLRLGDLTEAEVAARVAPREPDLAPEAAARTWLRALRDEGRLLVVKLGGESRHVAVEDAGRLRDAFGIAPPRGLPQAFLEPVTGALDSWLLRHARSHGPFTTDEVARRYAIGAAPVAAALRSLAERGKLLAGAFRPGGTGDEWCAPDVLAALKRKSLARLRKQVEPAEPSALGRLLVDWHGVAAPDATTRRATADSLIDVVETLQGAAIPASILEDDVLPARLPGYRPALLDEVCAAGEVVWAGVAPLGDRDGRVALYLADDLPLFHALHPDAPRSARHDALREALAQRGACFFGDLHSAVGGLAQDGLLDLWDLVWSGEVTNDSPAALRAFLASHQGGRRRGSRRLSSFRTRRTALPAAVGRWSLLSPPVATATERLAALAEQLLARHGVLTRDAVAAENAAGGFATLYPVLRALEEAGRIRRGYFVAGLGGSQFADAGALERLRARREADLDAPQAVVLAAADPANPYGAALSWPKEGGARLARDAGAHVVVVEGALAAFVPRGERDVVLFLPEAEPARGAAAAAIARALAAWCVATGRASLGWGASSAPLVRGPLAPFLAKEGFEPSGPGFRVRSARVAPE